MALRLLLLCNLAGGWACVQSNPAYEFPSIDASLMNDVAGAPEASHADLADTVTSPVEPPGMDGVGPPDSPLDAPMDRAVGTEAGSRDANIESRSDVATDTKSDGGADILQAPKLMLNKVVYNLSEEIVTSFYNGPGDAADWIGIYDESAPAPSDDNRSLLWYYTDNKGWDRRDPGPGPKNGTVVFGPGSRGSRQWPLPAGRYKALFLSDPHTELAAPVYFQVR
jgi:hypothetical protein